MAKYQVLVILLLVLLLVGESIQKKHKENKKKEHRERNGKHDSQLQQVKVQKEDLKIADIPMDQQQRSPSTSSQNTETVNIGKVEKKVKTGDQKKQNLKDFDNKRKNQKPKMKNPKKVKRANCKLSAYKKTLSNKQNTRHLLKEKIQKREVDTGNTTTLKLNTKEHKNKISVKKIKSPTGIEEKKIDAKENEVEDKVLTKSISEKAKSGDKEEDASDIIEQVDTHFSDGNKEFDEQNKDKTELNENDSCSENSSHFTEETEENQTEEYCEAEEQCMDRNEEYPEVHG